MTTYGISTENLFGKLVISQDKITPWLLGKATFIGAGVTNTYDASNNRVTPFNYSISGSGNRLAVITLPTHATQVWYAPPIIGASDSIISIKSFHDVSQTPSAPEVYIFSVQPHSVTQESFGFQIFNTLNQRVFDSASRPLIFTEVFSRPAFNGTASLTNMSNKPGFLLAYYGFNQRIGASEDIDGYIQYSTTSIDGLGVYSRINNILYFQLKTMDISISYGTAEDAYYELGSNDYSAICHLDSTVFD